MTGFALGGLLVMSMGLAGLAYAGVAIFLGVAGHLDWVMTGMNVLPGALIGVLLAPIGFASFTKARGKSKQRTRGAARAARVLGCRLLTRGQLQSKVELSLLIVSDDAPAYQSTLQTGVLTDMLDNFRPGQVLLARVGESADDYTLEVL